MEMKLSLPYTVACKITRIHFLRWVGIFDSVVVVKFQKIDKIDATIGMISFQSTIRIYMYHQTEMGLEHFVIKYAFSLKLNGNSIKNVIHGMIYDLNLKTLNQSKRIIHWRSFYQCPWNELLIWKNFSYTSWFILLKKSKSLMSLIVEYSIIPFKYYQCHFWRSEKSCTSVLEIPEGHIRSGSWINDDVKLTSKQKTHYNQIRIASLAVHPKSQIVRVNRSIVRALTKHKQHTNKKHT